MGESLWNSTLGSLRERMASGGPMPGGVALSAITASLGLAMLAMVLEITSRGAGFSGDRTRLDELLGAARREAIGIGRYADDDIAAFESYLTALRMPRTGAAEQGARRDAIRAALRRAIEVPLGLARAITAAIELSIAAAPLVNDFAASDLGAAALSLASAVQTILLSVDFNIGRASFAPDFQSAVRAERIDLESRAIERAALAVRLTSAALRR